MFLHYLDVPRLVLKARVEKRNANLPVRSFHVSPEEGELWFDSWFEPPDEMELQQYDGYRVLRVEV